MKSISVLKNCTPHTVKIVANDGALIKEFTPSGDVARLQPTTSVVGEVAGVPVTSTTYGEPIGLPEEKEGVGYIVSALLRTTLTQRSDLFSPGQLVRDSDGNVIGCKSLDH